MKSLGPGPVLLSFLFLPFLVVAGGCSDRAPAGSATPDETAAAEESHGAEEPHGGEERKVRLSPELAERFGIVLETAGPGEIHVVRELPGEVRVNGDRLAHVSPRVGGIAREVLVSLGDRVRQGQLLAVLESRELADARAALLAARARHELAREVFEREDRLRARGVNAEQDWLAARAALSEARVALDSARQKLIALGIPADEIDSFTGADLPSFTTWRLVAPIGGEVIDRHVTRGETVAALQPVFTIADLSTVWIDLSVYPRDLADVAPGAPVEILARDGQLRARATIDFVLPMLGEETRTALARVVLPNPDRSWRPGMFVSGRVTVRTREVPVAVPPGAMVRLPDGDEALFVHAGDGAYELREIEAGLRDGERVEVVSGLGAGERYVARGGFSLLAELSKESFADGHGH